MVRCVLLGVMVSVVGCGQSAPELEAAPEQVQEQEAAPAVVVEWTEADKAALAAADLADGTADHVIKKCAVCALAMDGSEAHVVQLADYTAHACSAHCAHTLSTEPQAVLGKIAGAQ